LAISFFDPNHEQLFDRITRDSSTLFFVEDIEHHRGIGHRRKNCTEAILTVEPFRDEIDRPIDRTLPQTLRKYPDGWSQNHINATKKRKPYPALMWSLGRRPDRVRWLDKQFVDFDSKGIFGAWTQSLQNKQRHQHRARPVGHFRQVEGKPPRQQHDLDRHFRHAAPIQNAEKRQKYPRENIGMYRTAASENRFARASHVGSIRGVADHLERKIGLHACTHIEVAVVIERPATMLSLVSPQIDGNFLLQLSIPGFTAIMSQQHVFGRDRRIRFQFEYPMSISLLAFQKRLRRTSDRRLDPQRS
jgi:hypothetical protein